MNIEILYMLMPLVVALHGVEEVFTRKSWLSRHTDAVGTQFPFARKFLKIYNSESTLAFVLIVVEELLIISLATVAFIYSEQEFLLALFYGFGIHLLLHIIQSIVLRCYTPGLITSIVILPYSVVGVANMLVRFPGYLNISLALCGLAIMAGNLVLCHSIAVRVCKSEKAK